LIYLFETIYRIALWGYFAGIKTAALFHPKARKWVSGRVGLRGRLSAQCVPAAGKWIWIHCASLGEFEQGRPVLEGIKARDPDTRILLTFFSPSGYEIRKDYPLADCVEYLPEDRPSSAAWFLDAVRPEMAIFVKYEFWYFFLRELRRRRIPTYLISAVFRSGQLFFRPPFNRLHLAMLRCFSVIFVQNEASRERLSGVGIHRVVVAGDTRMDRVVEIARKGAPLPAVSAFCGSDKVLVAGSTWAKDVELLLRWWGSKKPEDWKLIIAPHNIQPADIQFITQKTTLPYALYSDWEKAPAGAPRLLIIDNIGMLSRLYRYGDLAYIGGGFGAGIHNILEPAAFGLPVVFGPKYQKFEEARSLVRLGGAFPVKNFAELNHALTNLLDETTRQRATSVIRRYVHENKGATERILAGIFAEKKG